MANPKPIYIEGVPKEVTSKHGSIEFEMSYDIVVNVMSANAVLLEQLSKFKGRNLTITFAVT